MDCGLKSDMEEKKCNEEWRREEETDGEDVNDGVDTDMEDEGKPFSSLQIGHVILAAIVGGITILVSPIYMKVTSLQLIWRSGTRSFHLRVPDL